MDLTKFDLVISVKTAARQAPFAEIQAEIQKLISDLVLRWENESACP